jgi:hypothetical protein
MSRSSSDSSRQPDGLKSLRFVDFIRVSTERQEQQGESLTIQRRSNARDIEWLGGQHLATYGGQEHATAGWEKKEVDRLQADARRGKFDAVMVAYSDRWSRDNDKSNEGLEIFRHCGIRFFVGTNEKDLCDPQAIFELEVQAALGKYQALNQAKKSLDTRIYRAQTFGKPTCGAQRPWGRRYDAATQTWHVIPECQAQIADVARRYLKGESLAALAREHDLCYANLCHVLRQRCGDTWQQVFTNKRLNIHEVVLTTIPRLLDEDVIRKVCRRLDAFRSMPKHTRGNGYLLSGYLYCAACGYHLYGETDPRRPDRPFYRHATGRAKRLKRECPVRPVPAVRAAGLEQRVLGKLFEMFGNPARIEAAVRAAVPDCDSMTKRRQLLAADLDKIDRARQRILSKVAKELITDEQADPELAKLRDRETVLRQELDGLAADLDQLPSQEELRRYVEVVKDRFGQTIAVRDLADRVHYAAGTLGETVFVQDEDGDMYAAGKGDPDFVSAMLTRAEQRKLIEAVFSQPLPGGKPAGIFVSPDESGPRKGGRERGWNFVMRGLLEFEQVVGSGVDVKRRHPQAPGSGVESTPH